MLQTMSAPYSGQCLCGAIKFAITSEPITVLSCFCDHCSRGAGGLQQLIGKFSIGEVQISTTPEDAISRYALTDTSSGNCKEKAFCRVCGCTLWTVPAAAQGKFLLIRLPLLGQGLDFKPRSEIFTRNRPTWVEPVKDVEQWEESRK